MADYLHALPSGYRIEEYELVRVLGSGGFGITYLGYDHHLDKAVAIKEYLPNDLAVRTDNNSVLPKSSQDKADYEWGLERFLNEAQTLARFDHRHIIKIHRFFRAHGTGYIVMEYAEGETLSEVLQRKGTFMEAELTLILFPILDGLAAVHEADFLHRDIKPSNIVIRDDGSPVLIDFGSARQAVAGKSRSVTAIVTPGYAPIEQYSVKGHQGPWTDIYGLGAVCYRCLVGEPPNDATERLREDPLIPATQRCKGKASAELLGAIDRALRVDEGERPQNIKVWRSELEGNNDTSFKSVTKHDDTVVTKAGKQGGFKDLTGLTKWTTLLLYVQVAISVIAIIFGMLEYQMIRDLMSGFYQSQSDVVEYVVQANCERQHILELIDLTIFVISGALILMWIYRANYNAHRIGASGMRFTPGWSVGWHFIPIANLWKPYQAIKEIWRTSVIPYNWSSQPVSSLLSWWWFSWIVFNVSGVARTQIGIASGEILVGLILSVYNGSGAIFAINRDHYPQIWQHSSDWGEWAVSWRWEGLLVEWIQANLVSQLCDVIRISSCLILITIISRVHKMRMSHAKLK